MTTTTINPPLRRYATAGAIVCWAMALAIAAYAGMAELTKAPTSLPHAAATK